MSGRKRAKWARWWSAPWRGESKSRGGDVPGVIVSRPSGWVRPLSNTISVSLSLSADRSWLAFVFRLALLAAAAAAGGSSGAPWWSPQFLGLGFLHLHLDGLDVQLFLGRSCDGRERGVDVSALGRLYRRFSLSLSPSVGFFVRGFSLGGMKCLFRSSFFLLSTSACFTWQKKRSQLLKKQTIQPFKRHF